MYLTRLHYDIAATRRTSYSSPAPRCILTKVIDAKRDSSYRGLIIPLITNRIGVQSSCRTSHAKFTARTNYSCHPQPRKCAILAPSVVSPSPFSTRAPFNAAVQDAHWAESIFTTPTATRHPFKRLLQYVYARRIALMCPTDDRLILWKAYTTNRRRSDL